MNSLPRQLDQATHVSPLRELLSLALPTIAQMASYTIMQFIDTLQLAKGAGDLPAAASGLAGFLVFCVMSLHFGTLMCVNTLVSQSVGAGTSSRAGSYLWQGVWFGIIGGIVLIPTLYLDGPILHGLGFGDEFVRQAQIFYAISMLALPVKMISMATGQFLLAIGRPGITLVAAVVSLFIDAAICFVLISGRYGFPRMGIAGAAWATNIAVVFELAVQCAFVFRCEIRDAFHTLDWRPNVERMKQLLSIGLPSGLQVMSEVLAWFLFAGAVMNLFGQAAITANNYMMQYMKVSFMPAFGLSAAVTALVGRYIGMGRLDLARRRAHLGFVVALVYMLSCGVCFFLGRHTLIGLFSSDPQVIDIGATLLLFAAVYQLFDAVYIIYIGALRGAGDTTKPAWITASLCWTIVVAGGFAITRLLPTLGPSGPWLMACVYGTTIGTILVTRFSRGRWRAIVSPTKTDEPRSHEAHEAVH